MDIDHDWQVKVDYTQTYTVTVDELNPIANESNMRQTDKMHQ